MITKLMKGRVMFQAIAARVQKSVDRVVSTFVTRVAVAIPFVISLGFTTAAAAVWLSRDYGILTACTVLASVFAIIGLVALGLTSGAVSTSDASNASSEPSAMIPATSATSSIDTETLLGLLGTIGPMALPGMVRLLARNVPLVLGVLILAYLLLSESKPQAGATTEANAT